MSEALTMSALQYACRRVEDFAVVNSIRNDDEKAEAVDLWMDSLGLDEALRAEFARWSNSFVGPDWDGAVLIGLMVGLFINQFNHDSS